MTFKIDKDKLRYILLGQKLSDKKLEKFITARSIKVKEYIEYLENKKDTTILEDRVIELITSSMCGDRFEKLTKAINKINIKNEDEVKYYNLLLRPGFPLLVDTMNTLAKQTFSPLEERVNTIKQFDKLYLTICP